MRGGHAEKNWAAMRFASDVFASDLSIFFDVRPFYYGSVNYVMPYRKGFYGDVFAVSSL